MSSDLMTKNISRQYAIVMTRHKEERNEPSGENYPQNHQREYLHYLPDVAPFQGVRLVNVQHYLASQVIAVHEVTPRAQSVKVIMNQNVKVQSLDMWLTVSIS